MQIKNKSNRPIPVKLKDGGSFHLDPGDSVNADVTNLEEIKRQVTIGENLTEVLPGSTRQDLSEVVSRQGAALNG